DGGPTNVGIESTLLDLRGPRPSILRPGVVGARELEPLVGTLASPNEAAGGAPRASPGMLERHYAPRARLVLFGPADVARTLENARALAAEGARVGMLVISVDAAGPWEAVRMPSDALRYGRRLSGPRAE